MQIIQNLEEILGQSDELCFQNIRELTEIQRYFYYNSSQFVRDNLNIEDRKVWIDSVCPFQIIYTNNRITFNGGIILGVLQHDSEDWDGRQWDESFELIYDIKLSSVLSEMIVPHKCLLDCFFKLVDDRK